MGAQPLPWDRSFDGEGDTKLRVSTKGRGYGRGFFVSQLSPP